MHEKQRIAPFRAVKFNPILVPMKTNPFDLTGKTAVITGARTGLGQAMAIGLAEAGADVVTVSRGEMSATEKEIVNAGRRCLQLQEDLTDLSSIERIVGRTLEAFGGIDILVNNAGIIRRSPSVDFNEKDWDDVMNLNIKALFFLSQAVGREMLKVKRGKIINIASLLTFQGGILVPSYSASKGGVAQVTKTLANEWASSGICVNAIAPGYMATPAAQAIKDDPVRNKSIVDRIPAGRWGRSTDLNGAVVFLASEASDYVNGHVLTVDGGWMGR